MRSAREIWEFIEKKTAGILSVINGDILSDLAIKFSPGYLQDSDLRFMGSKQKTFWLKGKSGKALVDSIRNQINKQASEWRRLPELEDHPNMVVTSLLEACGDDGRQSTAFAKLTIYPSAGRDLPFAFAILRPLNRICAPRAGHPSVLLFSIQCVSIFYRFRNCSTMPLISHGWQALPWPAGTMRR